MAVYDSNIIDYHWAICWNLPIIAKRTRCGYCCSSLFSRLIVQHSNNVISKNRYSDGTISRKDFHYIFDDRILRDYTPNTYFYLAGIIDGDGYLGKNTIEITLHSKEISVLYRIKALLNGTVSFKGDNTCR